MLDIEAQTASAEPVRQSLHWLKYLGFIDMVGVAHTKVDILGAKEAQVHFTVCYQQHVKINDRLKYAAVAQAFNWYLDLGLWNACIQGICRRT